MTRKRFSPSVLRAILVKQAWRCACCGEAFYDNDDTDDKRLRWHFDHITSLEAGGEDTVENLQALLIGHHKAKTRDEAGVRGKIKRIQESDGLKRKKMSKRDKVMAKILRVMV